MAQKRHELLFQEREPEFGIQNTSKQVENKGHLLIDKNDISHKHNLMAHEA
jgi:hypothetical protein